jgi:prepilin-type N-terminal cleavage/methylation domain-containing protein
MFIRKPSAMGYTIIELLVVITIVGILSAIGISSYSNLQKDARDNQRASKIEALSAALERYYVENGEYPGCTQLVNQSVADIATNVLNGIDTEVLAAPNSSEGTNSLASCWDLSGVLDIFAYVVPTDDDCRNGQSCLQYTLQYRKESTGQIISVPSIHAAAIAATPTTPSVAVARVVDNVVATAGASTCSSGTLQYSFSVSVNGASASNTNWSTIATSSQLAEQGKQYEYTARARCYVDQVTYSPVALSSPATYTAPIAPPSAPTVTVATVGNSTTYTWSAVTCSVGTPRYQYRYSIAPSGFVSNPEWNASTIGSVTFTTSTLGQTYTVAVRAECYNTYTFSGWGAQGSGSYYRPSTTYAFGWSNGTGADAIEDADGNIIAVGGSGLFVRKFNTYGEQLWAKRWVMDESHEWSEAVRVFRTPDGNYMMVGNYMYDDRDTQSILMIKFDTNGNEISNRSYHSWNDILSTNDAVQSSDGGYVLTGSLSDCTKNYILSKFDASGVRQWSREWGDDWNYQLAGCSNKVNRGEGVIETVDGGYVVVGVRFETGGGSIDPMISTIIKYSSSGDKLWHKKWAGVYDSVLRDEINVSLESAVATPDGGFLAVGTYGNVRQIVSGLSGTGTMLIKYSSSGNIEWDKVWVDSRGGSSYGLGVILSSSGNYIVAGRGFDGKLMLLEFNSTGGYVRGTAIPGAGVSSHSRISISELSNGNFLVSATNHGVVTTQITRVNSNLTMNNCTTTTCPSILGTSYDVAPGSSGDYTNSVYQSRSLNSTTITNSYTDELFTTTWYVSP